MVEQKVDAPKSDAKNGEAKVNDSLKNNGKLPHLRTKRFTPGQKAADWIAKWAGSWTFIFIFFLFILCWMILNSVMIIFNVWDQYPFILLNLFLSCLAAIQAPVILMSQNRQAEIDRQRSQYDYLVNRKAEREVKQLQLDVLEMKEVILKQPTTKQTDRLREEIKKIQDDLNKLAQL